MVAKSIASFERTLLSGNSPFDRWKYGHDPNAVNSSVKRGFAVFTSPKKANCAVCHDVGKQYALFTDNNYVLTAASLSTVSPSYIAVFRIRSGRRQSHIF